MDRCPPDDVLLDLGEGRLSESEAERASSHLEACGRCRSSLAELMALRDEAALDRAEPGGLAEARVLLAIRRAGSRAPRQRRTVPLLRWGIAAAVLLASTAGYVGLGMRTTKAGVVAATIASAAPRVVVLRGDVERIATAGMELLAGDRVSVPVDSGVVLVLPDDSRAELGPESVLTLHDPWGDAPLELQGGFLAVDAAHRPAGHPLSIRTPDALAEVLGTRFTLGADSEETHLRVAEGTVHFVRTGDGVSVDVEGGHRAEVVDHDRAKLLSHPSLPGTALIIASEERAPADFARFNRLVGARLLGRRLRHLAFQVETRSHADLTAADLVGRPLVIVSYSEEDVGFEESLERVGLRGSAAPVLCFEPLAFPTLGLTGGVRARDYDWQGGEMAVDFPIPGHPLSGGLSGTRLDLFDRPGCFGWARPGPRAVTIAHAGGDPSKAVMFAYEAGEAMVGVEAKGRRVGLFLDPSQVGEDSEPAWNLVEAAVEWCVEPTRVHP